ncbi:MULTISPECIES: alpha/beta hydrolase [unclassified Herbaspirillum]|uniref:alpha/beta hydrolase n=1 Tax=unclassified Herbaspirillum TaxID=2624150 RepID=UPI0011529477|nr:MULTISPECIES: alpha/beta hydrolase [unclassified Herbaspirillum]MBB5390083.1 acetyl esterase [Herbaspirillum sp. SJZ102]TQK09418.1 acetyl esterase [Herbaspirillum sp. SJZ130]TQK13895.1 acetyl esterase [Herbaspirillum sp. SJZ106]TWC69619.1 acetyl esterase [Herbaspirillum sp. SJZ099]
MTSTNSAKELDPQLAEIVRKVAEVGIPPPFSGTPEQARGRLRQAIERARAGKTLPEVLSTEDVVASDEVNGQLIEVPVRVYRPLAFQGRIPTVVFFHGGGFVLGSVELMDDIVRKLCRDTGAVVVSADYRLAPEHPFPAAHDDALAATRWALKNVETLGGDPLRVAVAGESAGANLATSAAILVSRESPRSLVAQLLVVPGIDMARDVSEIEARGIDYPMLKPNDLRDISRLYMGENMTQSTEFPPSPLRATALESSPPALIAVAGHDPLRPEGLAYADKLAQNGVPVKVLDFDSMFHLFFGMFEASAGARLANDQICQSFSRWIEAYSSEGAGCSAATFS